jgi:hypothetical protein
MNYVDLEFEAAGERHFPRGEVIEASITFGW